VSTGFPVVLVVWSGQRDYFELTILLVSNGDNLVRRARVHRTGPFYRPISPGKIHGSTGMALPLRQPTRPDFHQDILNINPVTGRYYKPPMPSEFCQGGYVHQSFSFLQISAGYISGRVQIFI
jgi:hypothetical protein